MCLIVRKRDGLRGLRLLELGQQFGIVDRHQDLAGSDVLAAIHRALGNAACPSRAQNLTDSDSRQMHDNGRGCIVQATMRNSRWIRKRR